MGCPFFPFCQRFGEMFQQVSDFIFIKSTQGDRSDPSARGRTYGEHESGFRRSTSTRSTQRDRSGAPVYEDGDWMSGKGEWGFPRSTSTRSTQRDRSRAPVYSEPDFPPHKPETLIVAISAHDPVVSSLKSKSESKVLSAEDGSALYEACRYLGRQNGICLDGLLDKLRDKHPSENSEYDVYLVKIDLKKWDDRFDPNINQMDRLDAFRKLDGARFELSDLLSVSVYQELELYRR